MNRPSPLYVVRDKLFGDRELVKELIRFGKHLLLTGLMLFIRSNVNQMIVAKMLGVASKGFYVVATRSGRTMGERTATTGNRVLCPAMARLNNNHRVFMIRFGVRASRASVTY